MNLLSRSEGAGEQGLVRLWLLTRGCREQEKREMYVECEELGMYGRVASYRPF